MKKFIGKPYAGKPHVRIDEGAGKGIFPLPALLYYSPQGSIQVYSQKWAPGVGGEYMYLHLECK
jgi:hypothetical protein